MNVDKQETAVPVQLLTVAGSDSGGAAGLQADLKTWTAVAAYGMSAVTAVTAQNSREVTAVAWMSPEFVAAQMDAVLSDYGVNGLKTGFLGRVEIVMAVAALLKQHAIPNVVVDPVLVNHRGQEMFSDVVRQRYLTELLPLADVITPNVTETAVLLQTSTLDSLARLRWAVDSFHYLGVKNVLIKGFRDGDEVVDVLSDGRSVTELRAPLLHTENTHGSGDTLSAAICAFLAQGDGLETAVVNARYFTYEAIRRAAHWRLGGGHGPLAHF